jgi:hypothetical protein
VILLSRELAAQIRFRHNGHLEPPRELFPFRDLTRGGLLRTIALFLGVVRKYGSALGDHPRGDVTRNFCDQSGLSTVGSFQAHHQGILLWYIRLNLTKLSKILSNVHLLSPKRKGELISQLPGCFLLLSD